MNTLLLNNLNQLLTLLTWLLVAMGLILLLKQTFSMFSTALQLWEEWRQRKALTEQAQAQTQANQGSNQHPIRGNLSFESPDIEPAIGTVNDQLNDLNDISREEIEWAYEQGAESIEDVLEIVSSNKRGERGE